MTEQTTREAPFRLALRVEGEFWNAYIARRDTMAGAILLGSIRVRTAREGDFQERFMELMLDALAAAATDIGAISWPEPAPPAPEHERSGSA